MPQAGVVAPSYARSTTPLRSMRYDSAHRACALSNGGLALLTINGRGHGSSQEYGASFNQGTTLGLRHATSSNEPTPRMPMLAVSSSLLTSASATLVSGPTYLKLIVLGVGVTFQTLVPHQS